MKKYVFFAVAVLQFSCAGISPDQSVDAQTAPKASSEDFQILAGGEWTGHLSYLDYSSNSLSRIPVEIQVNEPQGRSLVYSIRYPGESQYNSKEKIKFSRDGRKLNGDLVIARARNDKGDLTLVTTATGKDNNRLADIRVTYSIGTAAFSIAKEVRYEGESEYFVRNEYSFVR